MRSKPLAYCLVPLALGMSATARAQYFPADDYGKLFWGPGVAEQIESGLFHNCVLTDCGTIECSGLSWFGQLQAPSASDFVDVAAGGYHSCGLHADGSVECWGADWLGQASPPATAFESIEAGWYHTCGRSAAGLVECWGDAPLYNPPFAQGETLAAGASDTCAVGPYSLLACEGQGSRIDLDTPILGQDKAIFEQVEVAYEHGCAITGGRSVTGAVLPDRTLSCWGGNTYGQISGAGATANPSSSRIYDFPQTDWQDVDTGAWHTCGIESGSLVCWGANYYGQASPPAGAFTDVSTGYQHSCAIAADGSVQCWGDGYYDQTDTPDLSTTCPLLTGSGGGWPF